MSKDFSAQVARLIEDCSGLPDLRPGDYIEAGLGALGGTMTDARADEPVAPPAMSEADEDLASQRFDQAAAVFAVHYGLDQQAVWDALYELEAEAIERGGQPWFGPLLSSPVGWTALGIRVAEMVTGLHADDLPAPFLLPERDPPPIVRTHTPVITRVGEVPPAVELTDDDWFFRIALWEAGLQIARFYGVPFEDVRAVLNVLPQDQWELTQDALGWSLLSAHVALELGLEVDTMLKPTIN